MAATSGAALFISGSRQNRYSEPRLEDGETNRGSDRWREIGGYRSQRQPQFWRHGSPSSSLHFAFRAQTISTFLSRSAGLVLLARRVIHSRFGVSGLSPGQEAALWAARQRAAL